MRSNNTSDTFVLLDTRGKEQPLDFNHWKAMELGHGEERVIIEKGASLHQEFRAPQAEKARQKTSASSPSC